MSHGVEQNSWKKMRCLIVQFFVSGTGCTVEKKYYEIWQLIYNPQGQLVSGTEDEDVQCKGKIFQAVYPSCTSSALP